MDYTINFILIANGGYDIICAFSILWLANTFQPFIYLATLHSNMFIEKENRENPLVRRLQAYWILTYGFARLFAGIKKEILLDIVAAITYFLEAFCYEYERWYANSVNPEKTTFVTIFSFLLGVVVILRPLGYYYNDFDLNLNFNVFTKQPRRHL